MKTLSKAWLICSLMLVWGAALCAQDPGRFSNAPRGVVMAGKRATVVYPNGQSAPLTGEFKFQDGSSVSPDGLLRRPNGAILQLKHGERVDMDGHHRPSVDRAPADYPPIPAK